MFQRPLIAIVLFCLCVTTSISARADDPPTRRLLYVATPGIRNIAEFGGHGILVFDIDANHKFLKRIPTAGLDEKQMPLPVKGICASATTQRLYISATRTLQSFDLASEKLIWEKAYSQGCDRMAISPDGKFLYVPSMQEDDWKVINGETGDVIATLVTNSSAHNTVISLDGKHAYLAGIRSNWLTVTDTSTHKIERTIGPFSTGIRPFTINGRQSLCFLCVNQLLGFEVGDISAGKKLHRVEVQGFSTGEVKWHTCPTHGIGLTPDEKEIWICDGFNHRLHLFDVSMLPPKQLTSIKLRDEPGWITFSLNGKFAYPSTGEIIDVASRKIIGGLTDENGTAVQSETILEIHWRGDQVVRVGDQFGLGRLTEK